MVLQAHLEAHHASLAEEDPRAVGRLGRHASMVVEAKDLVVGHPMAVVANCLVAVPSLVAVHADHGHLVVVPSLVVGPTDLGHLVEACCLVDARVHSQV